MHHTLPAHMRWILYTMWSDLDSWDKAQYKLEEEGSQNYGKTKVSFSTHLAVHQLLFHVTQHGGTLVIYSQSHALNCIKRQSTTILMKR